MIPPLPSGASLRGCNQLPLQQKVKANMLILGYILTILVAVSGAFLLVTAEDDALASISGMVFVWAVIY